MPLVESWRKVRGYPDYEVSDFGRVRSNRFNGAIRSPVARERADEIRAMRAGGMSITQIAQTTGFPYHTVKRIIARKTHRFESRVLSGKPNGMGYPAIGVYDSLGRQHSKVIHRLVAGAFMWPPPFDGAVINHIDGDKTNNMLENLEWVTQAENMRHADRIGLINFREMSRLGHEAKKRQHVSTF